MSTVRLSTDDYEAARQIVAWLAYPDSESQRERGECALFNYLQRLAGQIPRYQNGKAVEFRTTQSRMLRIDKLFFEAINAGQISALSVVQNGYESKPWPVNWGLISRKLSDYPANEGDRGPVYDRYWRRYRPVLHLASAMNSYLASMRKVIDWQKPLEFLLLDGSWVDPVLSQAADFKKYSNPKMHRLDQKPEPLDFIRQPNFLPPMQSNNLA